jgi:hypothetical protein
MRVPKVSRGTMTVAEEEEEEEESGSASHRKHVQPSRVWLTRYEPTQTG